MTAELPATDMPGGTAEGVGRSLWVRLRLIARRYAVGKILAGALVVASVAAGSATVITMTGSSLVGPDPRVVIGLLYLDAVLLLLLGAVVLRRIANVWIERRRGLAGSRLHIRFVFLFSVVSVTPAILVAVFSAMYLNYGIQAWFNDRVRSSVESSLAVAKAYLYEHQQNIRADAFAMAADINREAPGLINAQRFSQMVTGQAAIRSLPEAIVIDNAGRVLARSPLSQALEFDLVPPWALARADSGEIAVLTTNRDDRVRAVIRLDRFVDAYLVIGRLVDPTVLDHIETAERAVSQYKDMEQRGRGIQVTFVMIFVVVALLLLMAAVWVGLAMATSLVRPITELIGAAERVRQGDLSVRVPPTASDDELATLSRAFNRMTGQLDAQQRGLMEANQQLAERTRFTEIVLAGVSAGVIGLEREGRIYLPNRSAEVLLETDLKAAVGRPLAGIVPEMADLLAEAQRRPERPHQGQISLARAGRNKVFLVRLAAERMGDDVIGYVVTFDDITELMSAQRTAAWADVARRIAHEIKNPLTPIQLSAERLKRRYLKRLKGDTEIFEICTDTIIRRVEDIGRMVDEFSAFARMPQPEMRRENLSEICRQVVFMETARLPAIAFDTDLGAPDVYMLCDSRQVGRALTNVTKNAIESIEARLAADAKADPAQAPATGHIRLALVERASTDGLEISIVVEDNGIGLPKDQREKLTEPYVTTREKGTGLGLAIVKKIMEDHAGRLMLDDSEGGGARITLFFRTDADDNLKPAEAQSSAEQRALLTAARVDIHGA